LAKGPRLSNAVLSSSRPVLFRGREISKVGESVRLFRDTMIAEGFDEEQVNDAMQQCWVWYEAHLAENDEQAWDEFLPAMERANRYVLDMRKTWNPQDQEVSASPPPPLPRSAYGRSPDPEASELLVGSPARVIEQLKLLRNLGVENLMLTNRGLTTREQTTRYLTLLSEEVMPALS
jgi:hypothetical protein